jgi:hypothetical protein
MVLPLLKANLVELFKGYMMHYLSLIYEPFHVSHDRFIRDVFNRGLQILLNLIYIVKGSVL